MAEDSLKQRLAEILGTSRVSDNPQALAAFASDLTECAPRQPRLAVQPTTTEEVAAVVKAAAEAQVPVTARVAATNVGGLAIPAEGGLVLDLSRMNRILAVDEASEVALIEPGVTWEQLKARLDELGGGLTVGYPLSPPDSSVLLNALLDGLGNLSLRHGTMGHQLNGVEAVLADGTIVRTGAGALSDVWFSRAPLPDLTGLFVGFQGTTGIVTRGAVQLWPRPAVRYRAFLLAYDRRGAFEAMRRLARLAVCDDIGGLSWVAGRLLFHGERPADRDPQEPEIFLYLDIGGASEAEVALRRTIVAEQVAALRASGFEMEEPLELGDLVRLEPRFAKFADFPTRLDFLLDYPGGGLTWVGTYGPLPRFEAFADASFAIMERCGMPPLLVSRPMLGGHFGVMRLIALFDKRDAAEVERVRSMQVEICEAGLSLGFIPYKTPAWVAERIRDRLNPGFVSLFRRVRDLLDPRQVFSPENLKL